MGVVFAFLSIRTSMTRHVLFPAGRATLVMRATLLASAIGVPVMIALAMLIGPLGAAIGYAITEGLATLLLWAPCAAELRDLRALTPRTEKDDVPAAACDPTPPPYQLPPTRHLAAQRP